MVRLLQTLSLVLAVGAVATMVLGSTGFSAMQAERPVDVSVVEDENAYLSVADSLQCGAGNGNGDNKALLKNQLGTALTNTDLTIAVPDTVDEKVSVKLRIDRKGGWDTSKTIEPGTSATADLGEFNADSFGSGETIEVLLKSNGNENTPEHLTVQITANGKGISAILENRTVLVNCPGKS